MKEPIVAMAKNIAKKAHFDGGLNEVAGLVKKEESHWREVKHYAKMFFGDDLAEHQASLPTDMKSYRWDASALPLRELRKRSPHQGFNLFVNIVHAKFHPNLDAEAMLCFLVKYLGLAESTDMHSLNTNTLNTDFTMHS